jgi:formylglycine-generating enzyme required for sulfatase activity
MRLRFYVPCLNAPRWLTRLALFTALPCGVLALASVVVHADAVRVPHVFQEGDLASAAAINENFKALVDTINTIAATTPECPVGYKRDTSTSGIVCKKGLDEVVRVKSGGAAFWIDRYEASIWSAPDGSGVQHGAASDDFPASFPKNGQVGPDSWLYAQSRPGVVPTAYVTWFQANVACRASGKQLPSLDRWLAAASGTSDPGADGGTGSSCVTSGGSVRATGLGATGCQSSAGAQDMIGNLAEWTAEWYAGLRTTAPDGGAGDAGSAAGDAGTWRDTAGGNYGGDGLFSVTSRTQAGNLGWTPGLPSAALRGGSFNDGIAAGVYAFSLSSSPSDWGPAIGFRCVVPR